LKNKQNYYNQIALEDTKRITAFEKRLVELESWAKSRKK
jgi:hypothetical protein